MVFKRNQIVVLSLVLVILVAGYLQYTYKKGSSANSASRLGEAVYVDNGTKANADNASGNVDTLAQNVSANLDKGTSETSKAPDKGKSSEASKTASDFFASAKLDKDMSRSKSADSLKAIAEDETASKEVRDSANEQRMKLIQTAEKEARIESLIKEKSFEDVVVLFADDGSIDIVVKTQQLSASQTTQIADIASRQAKVSMDQIHVRSFY